MNRAAVRAQGCASCPPPQEAHRAPIPTHHRRRRSDGRRPRGRGRARVRRPCDRVTTARRSPRRPAPTSSSSTPRAAAVQLDLRGIGYGEKIRGLDVRPSTGVLYAVTDADRVYTIDLKARRATPTGPAFMPADPRRVRRVRLQPRAGQDPPHHGREREPPDRAGQRRDARDRQAADVRRDRRQRGRRPGRRGLRLHEPGQRSRHRHDALRHRRRDGLARQAGPAERRRADHGRQARRQRRRLQGRLRHRARQHRLGAAAAARRQARPVQGRPRQRRRQARARRSAGHRKPDGLAVLG